MFCCWLEQAVEKSLVGGDFGGHNAHVTSLTWCIGLSSSCELITVQRDESDKDWK